MDFPALLKVEEFVIKKHFFFPIQFHRHIVDFDGMSSQTGLTLKAQLVEFKGAFYTWNNSRHDLKRGSNHTLVLNKTTEPRSPRDGLGLVLFENLEWCICSGSTADPVTWPNNLNIFCLATDNKRSLVNTVNVVSYPYVFTISPLYNNTLWTQNDSREICKSIQNKSSV